MEVAVPFQSRTVAVASRTRFDGGWRFLVVQAVLLSQQCICTFDSRGLGCHLNISAYGIADKFHCSRPLEKDAVPLLITTSMQLSQCR